MNPAVFFDNQADRFASKLLATPLLNKISELPRNQLKYLFSQLYYFVDIFPGYLGLLLWKSNNPNIRFSIADNLVDECGGIQNIKNRNFSMMHSELLKDFVNKLEPNTLCPSEMSVHTSILTNNLDRLFRDASLVEALGVMACMEVISTRWFTLLNDQLRKRNEFSDDDLYFFKLHLSIDDEHGSVLTDILLPLLKDAHSYALLQHGINTASLIWEAFYTGIGVDLQ